jgi:hypothetical protein
VRAVVPALLIIVLSSCGEDHSGPLSYEKDIAPITLRRCVQCHNESESQASIQVQTYEHLLKSRSKKTGFVAIRPGEPDSSRVFQVISTTNEKQRMPPPGQDVKPLTEEQIARVRRWIAEGAKP